MPTGSAAPAATSAMKRPRFCAGESFQPPTMPISRSAAAVEALG